MAHCYFSNSPHGTRKNGSKLDTRVHQAYICREDKYEHIRGRKEDLVFKAAGNMPSWADDPGDFWAQAEKHRRQPDGRAYREIRLGLQEELTLQENVELIEEFLKQSGIKASHAYTYAVHDKTATFDKEHRNIHVHIMFCEKVIEKDRPLPASKYFNMYKTNKRGEACQGYRTSTEYSNSKATYELRTKWVKIVNDKFKEKGLNITLTEKSLKAQREECLAAGKFQDAELLDRTPAPHLGSAYRNPKTLEEIKRMALKFKDENTAIPDLKDAGPKEKNIILFAADLAVRKAARELQQLRRQMHKQAQEEKYQEQAADIAKDPIVITAGDMVDYMTEKYEYQQQHTSQKFAEYKELKAKKTPEKLLAKIATDQVLTGYEKTRKEYAAISKRFEAEDKISKVLVTDPKKIHEYAQHLQIKHQLQAERTKIGYELSKFKKAAQERKPEIIAAQEKLMQHNAEIDTQLKKLYGLAKQSEKNAAQYQEVLATLRNKERSTILFEKELPRQLTRYAKINGVTPIRTMPKVTYHGQTYVIINQDPANLQAVRINDDVTRGKVPVYQITKDSNGSIKGIKTTENAVKIYRGRKETGSISVMGQHKAANTEAEKRPIIEATKTNNTRYAQELENVADKLLGSKDHEATLNGSWYQQDDNSGNSEAEQVEKEMYHGWHL